MVEHLPTIQEAPVRNKKIKQATELCTQKLSLMLCERPHMLGDQVQGLLGTRRLPKSLL